MIVRKVKKGFSFKKENNVCFVNVKEGTTLMGNQYAIALMQNGTTLDSAIIYADAYV